MARMISVRELPDATVEAWEDLTRSGDIILTSNGEPLAVLARIDGADVEATLSALRRARAQQAVTRLRVAARAACTDALTAAEIDAEIADVRRTRTP